jgi:hypothetical protein
MKLPLAVDIVGFLFTFYTLGFQTVACMILGYFTARKTFRSVFNWLVVGFIAGLIPLIGLVFMLIAYFFYPPPTPRSGPGYHPPRDRSDTASRRR